MSGTAAAPPRKTVLKQALQPPPAHSTKYHRLRKTVHLICFLVFVALPFLNVMRFDIPRARFYFAGYELWINEFGIIFLSLMFLLFVITAMSMVYGRMYCGYLCPQMIFSEFSTDLEARIRRRVNSTCAGWSKPRRVLLARVLWLTLLAVVSVFLSFVFMTYFVEPWDLLRRLLTLDIVTAGGIGGAVTTLVTFLDFTLVRQKFCTTVCPYGYLQGMLADDSTLLIEYRDEAKDCIECGKCVRVCEMGIDIRKSPYQIECVHCGECVDACVDVLGRLGKDGLIHYAWGTKGRTTKEGRAIEPWYMRLGFRDAKRFIVLAVVLVYASGLALALTMRHAVLVTIAADRSSQGVLFTTDAQGRIVNRFRMILANRGTGPATVSLEVQGLAHTTVSVGTELSLATGAQITQGFEIAVAAADLQPGVNHFRMVARSQPDQTVNTFDMTFIGPSVPESTPAPVPPPRAGQPPSLLE